MRRWTNLALFVLLGLAFTTGWVAFFYGTAPSRASLIVHAASGYAIVALTPWKAVIAARGVQRRRTGWWASLVFTGLWARRFQRESPTPLGCCSTLGPSAP